MASYYAQIDVNLYNAEGNPQKALVPRPPKPRTTTKTSSVTSRKTTKHSLSTAKIIGGITTSLAYANSTIGSYTGNKNAQSNISSIIGLGAATASAFVNPVFGITTMAAYTIKRTTDLALDRIKSEEESRFKQSYLGNMTTSGSRWR